MITQVADLLCCPHCTGALDVLAEASPTVLGCASGHRFDVARQGYLNLLSTPAGANADSTAMIQARTRYLQRGLHDPVRDLLQDASGDRVLDAGCGPGWYFATLPPATRIVGLDLSAAAARRAARAHPQAGAVVCDLRRRWPVVTGGFDTVWSIFAPRHPEEAARALEPDGKLLVVLPGPGHLQELVTAGVTIGLHPGKEERLISQLAPWFCPTRRESYQISVPADRELVREVVAMGPSAHHRQQLPDQLPEQVTVSLALRGFRRDDRRAHSR